MIWSDLSVFSDWIIYYVNYMIKANHTIEQLYISKCSSHCTHHSDMYADLNRLSLKNWRLMHKCIMVYKCLNGMAPQYLNDKITCNDNIYKYCSRSAKDLHVKKHNTAYYARSKVEQTLAYNNLPDHIKQQPSLKPV